MAPRAGVYATAVLTLLVGACGNDEKHSSDRKKGPPAPPVVIASVRQESVPLEVRAIGNVEAYSTVEVRSQVSGEIARVAFSEGQDVTRGQVLFQIDPRISQQKVQQAEADLANRRAALDQAQANYERDVATARNARAQADRYATLAARGIIAREQNEQYQTQATAAEKAAVSSKAGIESARAAVQGAEASVADARLQLGYTTIKAPISGRTGNLTRKAGNLVAANNDMLVTINQITPAYVTFSVPEQQLNGLRRYSSARKLPVQALPQQGVNNAPVDGVLDFLDNRVDPSTGTILLKARFPNTDRRLWPGQFANVSVRLATPTATVVPSAAIKSAQKGSYVYIVKPDNTAEQRMVQISRAWNDLTAIQSGVSPGEQVIVEGQLRVKPGAKVRVVHPGQQQQGAPEQAQAAPAGQQ